MKIINWKGKKIMLNILIDIRFFVFNTYYLRGYIYIPLKFVISVEM